MINALFIPWIRGYSKERTVNQLVSKLTSKIKYDYNLYLKLDIISESEFYQLISERRGRNFLDDIVSREFDDITQLRIDLYDKIHRKIVIVRRALIIALAIVLVSAVFYPLVVVALLTFPALLSAHLRSIFFTNIEKGEPSKLIKLWVSEIKIKNGEYLNVRTLSATEFETYLKSLPTHVAETMRVLALNGDYTNLGHLLRTARKLTE